MSFHEHLPESLRTAFEKFGHSKRKDPDEINNAGAFETPRMQAVTHKDHGAFDDADNSASMHETPPFGNKTIKDNDN